MSIYTINDFTDLDIKEWEMRKVKKSKKHILNVLLSAIVAFTLFIPATTLAALEPFKFDFKELLLNEGRAAENYLSFKTPREITVNAPKKFIEEIEIFHKKGNSLAETDVSLTNIDITTIGEEVDHILVTINGDTRVINRPFLTDGTRKKFEIGYAKLNDNFDIKIEVVTTNSEQKQPAEEMFFKVPEGSSNIFRVNQKFTYKTSGKKYTLYDLLAGKNLFTDLLVEHKIDDIGAEFDW